VILRILVADGCRRLYDGCPDTSRPDDALRRRRPWPLGRRRPVVRQILAAGAYARRSFATLGGRTTKPADSGCHLDPQMMTGPKGWSDVVRTAKPMGFHHCAEAAVYVRHPSRVVAAAPVSARRPGRPQLPWLSVTLTDLVVVVSET